ncbi:MAG: phenylacetate--CoA ligase family protein [Pseudomonadota bacterium]
MLDRPMRTKLPLYRNAIDWEWFDREFPAPDVYAETIFKWPAERVRELQNERFLKVMETGWSNAFYAERWREAGLEPGDVRSLDDIVKLPTFNSDDIKDSQKASPPFGTVTGIDYRDEMTRNPLKMQSSGGTTGKPRPTLFGALEWEMNGLQAARSLYIQGARPGHVMQIPATCSLANLAWVHYLGAHNYLGVMPITTGSGVVTPSLRQVEIAFDYGADIIMSFPEYLTQLAKVARDEFGRDIKELGLSFIPSYLGPDTDGALRKELESLYGCPVYDNYGTNEISHASFEGPDQDGLYLMEDCIYIEVLDTETGRPVAPGESGNLVATSLFRGIPPLIRFNLRDLGRIIAEGKTSALGSQFRRMDHFLGRSDDMVKIRGNNIYPMGCLSAVKSDPRATGEWICIAERTVKDRVIRDTLTVEVEVRRDAGALDGLKEHMEARLQADLGLKVDVVLVEEGALDEKANLGREGKPRRLIDRRKDAK